MNFFEKLVPFRSLFFFDSNTVTAYWVLATIIVFVYFLARLIYVVRRLRSAVRKGLQDATAGNIQSNRYLHAIWQEYSAMFLVIDGKTKTDEAAYDYFNEGNLLQNNLNLKLINSVPSALVGLGILGTFVGLTYGIANFKTTSSEQIKDSISVLLSGMGTAFITSIWGMFLSLLFTFIEKSQIRLLHSSLQNLCFRFDRQFKITREDDRQLELSRQRDLFNSYFLARDENGNNVTPTNVLRDIYSESRKQSQALQAFSTDLAVKVDAGFSRIIEQQNSLNAIPILETLQQEIVDLGTKLKDPATEMTQNVVKDLEVALKSMIDELKVSISGSTKSEMENLALLLTEAGSSLRSFPAIMQETVVKIDDLVTKLGGEITTSIGGVQKNQGELIQRQSEGVQLTTELLQAFTKDIIVLANLTQQFRGAADSFKDAHRNLGSAANTFNEAANQIKTSANELRQSNNQVHSQMSKFLSETSAAIEETQELFDHAKSMTLENAEKFEIIRGGLRDIFSKIQEGLSQYQLTVGDSLDTYLKKYSEALDKTANALASASANQEQLVADLIDEIGRFNSKARV